jgi:flagella basal body P-ring formation protein FlgA
LTAGAVVYQGQLTEPLAVKRGEHITLTSRRARVSISVAAKAMESGHVGEQIRVKNLTSERIVRAWIDGAGSASSSRPPGQ